MKVSITDLRRRMKDVLRALERNEDVRILRRGKWVGAIKGVPDKPEINVQDHPFIGMLKGSETVERQMKRLRGGRYCDL